MTTVFEYSAGTTPLLISSPHDGRYIPPGIANRMNDIGRAIPDTDWNVVRLYSFAHELGASFLSASCSRYVIDLNRSERDEVLYPGQLSTGLCPTASFHGEALYREGEQPDDRERLERIETYWRPYHDKLASTLSDMKMRFGYALLWDAHSIPGEVPLLFNGALPDLNIGTNGRCSCAEELETSVSNIAEDSPYSSVLNGRFKGGFITRHYGRPDDDVHAIQLELAQRCYMDEKTLQYDADRAERLGQTIRSMLLAFLSAAADIYAS
jgi:N-formylglutamate amidohydrolase